MDWGYVKTFGMVGLLALVIQLGVFVWERWFNTAWRGLMVPVTLRQILIEWVTYMLIFIVVSIFLQGVFRLICSFC